MSIKDPKEAIDILSSLLAKAQKRLSDEYDPDEDEVTDDTEGLTQFDPDEEQGDAADEWLKQNDSKKGKKNEKAIGQTDDSSDERAGVEEASATAKEGGKAPQEKIKELDPERLKALKSIAPHWLSHVDQVKKQTADARANPHLFAEGHRQAAHNAAHEDFNTAHHKFLSSEDYKKLSPTQKMRAEIKFKKEFQEKTKAYQDLLLIIYQDKPKF